MATNHHTNGGSDGGTGSAAPRNLPSPVFTQPEPTADPRIFKVNYPSDGPAYSSSIN
jgi:hypothetical protein